MFVPTNEIRQTLKGVDDTTRDARALVANMNALVTELRKADVPRLIEDVRQAVAGARALVGELNAIALSVSRFFRP